MKDCKLIEQETNTMYKAWYGGAWFGEKGICLITYTHIPGNPNVIKLK